MVRRTDTWQRDPDRRITLWNRGAERLTGWSSEAVLGRHCADGILRHCDEEGNVLCGNGCHLVAVMSDGASRATEVFMLHRDGSRGPVRVRGAGVYGKGKKREGWGA